MPCRQRKDASDPLLPILAPIVVATSWGSLLLQPGMKAPRASNRLELPQSAIQDMQAWEQDEDVWLLQCEDASYRVRLIVDMAAKVERIDKGQHGDK